MAKFKTATAAIAIAAGVMASALTAPVANASPIDAQGFNPSLNYTFNLSLTGTYYDNPNAVTVVDNTSLKFTGVYAGTYTAGTKTYDIFDINALTGTEKFTVTPDGGSSVTSATQNLTYQAVDYTTGSWLGNTNISADNNFYDNKSTNKVTYDNYGVGFLVGGDPNNSGAVWYAPPQNTALIPSNTYLTVNQLPQDVVTALVNALGSDPTSTYTDYFNNYNFPITSRALTADPVPAPIPLALIGTGLIGFCAVRRRRTQA